MQTNAPISPAVSKQQMQQPTPLSAQGQPSTQQGVLTLKDIHTPEPIANYPIAYGWWLVLTMSVISIFILIKKWRKNSLHKLAQKQALRTLKQNPSMDVEQMIALLKWAAIQYFPRKDWAILYSDNLKDQLLKTLPEKYHQEFLTGCTLSFAQQYQSTDSENINDRENFYQAAKLWLTQALPPKNKKQVNINKQAKEEIIHD